MRPTHHVLIAALAFALAGCTTNDPTSTAVDLEQAAGTIGEVEKLILADPGNALLFARRAILYERQDSLNKAENDWKRVISLDSTNAQWRIALGDLYFRKIRLDDAEQRFKEAIRLAPDSTEGRSKLSEVYLAQLRFKEAMALANEALRKDPYNAELYNLKGWIHRTAGDTNLAISSYQTAVERDPTYYDAYISLGILHAARHDPLAMDYYNAALEVRPTSVEALYDKAIFAQEHGQDSLALDSYARIKTIEPRYPLAYYNTGYILLERKKRTADARREFHRAIDLLPDYAQAYYNRGLTYELDGMLDSAYTDYRQTLRLVPNSTEAAEGISRLQARGLRVSAR